MRLLDVLKVIRDDGPPERELGICGNVAWIMTGALEDKHSALETMANLWREWGEFSGDDDFPVPAEYREPSGAFSFWEGLWVGDYGDARRRLLDFLIESLEGDFYD